MATITAGGVAQAALENRAGRVGYAVQNQSTGDLWINDDSDATASAPSIKVPAGALYETPDSYRDPSPVSIYGATTGQAFHAWEW